MVKVMGEVKGQGHTFDQYPTNALPFHFMLIRPTIPKIWLIVFDLEKISNLLKKKLPEKNKFPWDSSKS